MATKMNSSTVKIVPSNADHHDWVNSVLENALAGYAHGFYGYNHNFLMSLLPTKNSKHEQQAVEYIHMCVKLYSLYRDVEKLAEFLYSPAFDLLSDQQKLAHNATVEAGYTMVNHYTSVFLSKYPKRALLCLFASPIERADSVLEERYMIQRSDIFLGNRINGPQVTAYAMITQRGAITGDAIEYMTDQDIAICKDISARMYDRAVNDPKWAARFMQDYPSGQVR